MKNEKMKEEIDRSIFIHFGFIGEVPFFGVFGNERGNSKRSERGF